MTKMTKQNTADEINFCKARMDEIANTRPSTLELIGEYESLHDRIRQHDLDLAASQEKERALPVPGVEITWDRRTQHIHIIADVINRRKASVVFLHAPVVTEDLTITSYFTFDGVKALKTSQISEVDTSGYILGIVGLDRLGIYEVTRSNWAEALPSPEVSTSRHFCIIFADVAIEILASAICSGSTNNSFREVLQGKLLA